VRDSLEQNCSGVTAVEGPEVRGTTDFALNEASLSHVLDLPALRQCHTELSVVLFEHKWADLTLGDLEQQVRVGPDPWGPRAAGESWT
jgi:hypothetical protein